jgi:hypothetical protein
MNPMLNRPDLVYRLGVTAPISMPSYNENGVVMEIQRALNPSGFAGHSFGATELSTGAIVGIGAGGLVLGALLGFAMGRRKRR